MICRNLSRNDPGQVAFVHDALAISGGAERTLAAMLELFPGAPVYTLVYDPETFRNSVISHHPILPSPLDRLPGAHRHYRAYLPLFPYLVEQFDLGGYDVVISSSYAAAHGALTGPGQFHLAYLYTPMRHAWQDNAAFIRRISTRSRAAGWAAGLLLHRFRQWDTLAAQLPDLLLAASGLVADRVQRYYRRSAQVVYPPVEVEKFTSVEPKPAARSYYLAVSRLRPHKRVDLIVQAFNRLGYPLKIVGEGSELPRLRRIAGRNIEFLGYQPDENLLRLFGGAKALVHAAEEDFGITLVEAQAAGCPVIAYGKGGAAETVLPGISGILFSEQSVESLVEAVERFEAHPQAFEPAALRRNAGRFSKTRFQDNLIRILEPNLNQVVDSGKLGVRWHLLMPDLTR